MAVTAAMVKELRERTGAGMMDCKKALMANDGDMDKAIDFLRESGLAKAAKKSGRIAAEGLVRMAFNADCTKATAVEVNIETDFAAKNPEFVEMVEKFADVALNAEGEVCEKCMLDMACGEDGTVGETLTAKIAKIGENMSLRRAVKASTDGVKYIGYSHMGGKIGVIIGLKTDAAAAMVKACGEDVAMQCAAMRPQFLNEASVDPAFIEHETEIARAQIKEDPKMAGKPEAVLEKIIPGKVKAVLKEVCLLEQVFVKDSSVTVKQYVEKCAKEIGMPIEVVEMIRYEVGEGIEKKEENFAEEVAKQMAGN